MKYEIEDHYKLHIRRHKKNGTDPIKTLPGFVARYSKMKRGEISYEEMIEMPRTTPTSKSYYKPRPKKTKHSTLAQRCRDMHLNYQKVYQYLMKHPMKFNDFIKVADLRQFEERQERQT